MDTFNNTYSKDEISMSAYQASNHEDDGVFHDVDLTTTSEVVQAPQPKPAVASMYSRKYRAPPTVPRFYRKQGLTTIMEGIELDPQFPAGEYDANTDSNVTSNNIVSFLEGFANILFPGAILAAETTPEDKVVTPETENVAKTDFIDNLIIGGLIQMDRSPTVNTHKRITHHRSKFVIC